MGSLYTRRTVSKGIQVLPLGQPVLVVSQYNNAINKHYNHQLYYRKFCLKGVRKCRHQENLVTGPPGSMKQERVFFNNEWTKAIDDRFIRALMRQHVCGNRVVEGPNRKAIKYACDSINTIFGTTFDYEYCIIRYRKLRKRYKVFRWMVDTPEVSYNPLNHVVRAEAATWEKFFSEEKLSMAYGFKSELAYPSLWNLFSGDEEEEEHWKEVDRAGNINPERRRLNVNATPDDGEDEDYQNVEFETSSDSFCYELAWYKDVSESDSDGNKDSAHTAISTTNRASSSKKKRKEKAQIRRPPSGSSSVASSSPFKPSCG